MSRKGVIAGLVALTAGSMLAAPAHAGYVCKGMKGGETTDVSGFMQPQSSTSYVLPQPGGGYLIQVKGYSEGEEVDSYLFINEATRLKLQRCGISRELSFRVRCKAKGEPEVIQVVC